MSHQLQTQIRDVLVDLGIVDCSIIVAVSGGADSVAQFLILNALSVELNLTLCVGHFNHQLRMESDQDAVWVQELSKRLDVSCAVGHPEGKSADEASGSSEEAARKQRYTFLKHLAREQNARWISVAHTANDQVETILHHIARGSGLSGLKGIPAIREVSENISIVRPFLEIDRIVLRDFLSITDQLFLTDQTNTDPSFTRNRIRHEILPYLRETLNPQIDSALLRLAQQANAAHAEIEGLALSVLTEAIISQTEGMTRLSLTVLKPQSQAVLTTMFVALWTRNDWPRQNMTLQHWQQLAEMSRQASPRGFSCPGRIQVTLRKKVMEIEMQLDRSIHEDAPS